MLFNFNAHSALLLPFVVPGLALATHLGLRAWRQSRPADGLLALLLLLTTLPVAQWMLGFAGWYDSHDGYSTLMFYVPWRPWLGLGPVLYLYFSSLVNQDFKWRGQRRHLLPLLVYVACFAAAAAYDLGWQHGLQRQALPLHFGTKGWAASALDAADGLFEWSGYALLLAYGLATLRHYRRYRRYLDDHFSDTEQLRFAGFRDLLRAGLLLLLLGLGVRALEAVIGPLNYDGAWYAFLVNGVLLYFLSVVGLQANGAARVPLRFDYKDDKELMADATRQPTTVSEAGAGVLFPLSSSLLLPTIAATNGTVAQAPHHAVAPALVADAPAATSETAALGAEGLLWRIRLLALMADEQPWLEPELTLTELAHRLRTNPSVLSRVINTGCGQNFNDFVNTYRVVEAERKLADPRLSHYSLVGVALESGFNSKSTFNRVFKKLRGLTPSEVQRPGIRL